MSLTILVDAVQDANGDWVIPSVMPSGMQTVPEFLGLVEAERGTVIPLGMVFDPRKSTMQMTLCVHLAPSGALAETLKKFAESFTEKMGKTSISEDEGGSHVQGENNTDPSPDAGGSDPNIKGVPDLPAHPEAQ